ncbi:hypothetical protein CPB84DRAFT_795465 [Gymnopilus junonius]|uniref:Uncharacterized protein n=1 Tax=Gymnopilus junonius TaxID=109634 RepID=A0A9P5N7Y5_GYMJU|nr:hypothetical protein CPB84DRAFT_795465 [Gymnopilus junonius]
MLGLKSFKSSPSTSSSAPTAALSWALVASSAVASSPTEFSVSFTRCHIILHFFLNNCALFELSHAHSYTLIHTHLPLFRPAVTITLSTIVSTSLSIFLSLIAPTHSHWVLLQPFFILVPTSLTLVLVISAVDISHRLSYVYFDVCIIRFLMPHCKEAIGSTTNEELL